MKKLYKSILLLLFIQVSLGSCKKCLNCNTTNSSGKIVDTYQPTCGKKATLDVQELSYRKYVPDSLTLNCTRAKE